MSTPKNQEDSKSVINISYSTNFKDGFDGAVRNTSTISKDSSLKTYKELFIEATEDGIITKVEREFLNNKANEMDLADSEKKQIEEEIFGKYSGVPESHNSLLSSFEKLKKLSLTVPRTDEIDKAFDMEKKVTAALAIDKLREEVESLINNSRPSLVLQLQNIDFKQNFGKKTKINVRNDGNTPAKNVSFYSSGKIDVRFLSKLELLNPGESNTIEVWINPTADGELPIDISMKYIDGLERNYEERGEVWINVSDKVIANNLIDDINSVKKIKMNFEIIRGFSVLPNNDIKFGVRLTNITNFVINDADVILDYTKNLFSIKSSEIQHLGNLPPKSARTATYLLKPLDCIHNEQINALITYKNHTGKKQTIHMRPKEVHCVCPFLKEKPMGEGEYSRLAASSEFVQEGISFKGISVDDLAKFMGETCRHMLHKVREYDLEGKKVIYLSGESVGEKAYYLLTAVIQDYKGLTQVVLRAHSDKKYGLNGFMNEMADSLRHLVGSVQNAKEIGIIENKQVINIIDSVVQRTSFNMSDDGNAQVNIRDSVVQRSKIGKE